jgi:capsular polysaccharide transport system permease protein
MAIAFAAVFVLPVVLTALYLWIVARDQYASTVAFTVQREEAQSPVDILGGLTSLSGSTSSDSDILFEYIQSQEVVAAVDRRFDLRTLYARGYWTDPVFHLAPGATIEELLAYWRRMVHISYAPGTGLISVEVKAFAPEEAQAIAQMIFDESSAMINRLSAIARDDAIRYARDDLDAAVAQLKTARQAMTTFRSRTQIVDPGADIQAQMGLLSTLQQQLGAELINYDLLRQTTRADDPRVTQSDQRITAIRERIRQERAKFGAGGAIDGDGEDYAGLIAEYETLSVDLEFAQQKYGAALTNFDSALASAQRQSRYLAAYVSPTLAESAEYPRRLLLLGVVALILLGSWAVGVLVFYSLRDRR